MGVARQDESGTVCASHGSQQKTGSVAFPKVFLDLWSEATEAASCLPHEDSDEFPQISEPFTGRPSHEMINDKGEQVVHQRQYSRRSMQIGSLLAIMGPMAHMSQSVARKLRRTHVVRYHTFTCAFIFYLW